MSYEEEKEHKKQEKIRLKQEKKSTRRSARPNAEDLARFNAERDAERNTSDNLDAVVRDRKTEEEREEKFDSSILKKEKEPEKKVDQDVNIVKELLSLIIYIGIVIIICYCIITYVGQRTTVNGCSMENTLNNGDNLWIDKFTYHFTDPKRFDIIVFPYDDNDFYIKRVIGLPGETVQITSDGSIIIDGQRLTESYGKEIITDSGTASEPHTLGEDEYFVLGDNRNDSRDSRFSDVGDIDRDRIVGRAVFRLTPIKKIGKIDKD
ncbi:MAG: signal peptidase I [Eubacterium sp.]|nr:signal peptidase I [Eubacterium sp.]